ncbi:MAG: hypothetical protein LC772_05195, partial [Chloroflexi bacterium]|nr:hypothetical protein [Chloroflexota bacterium]
MTDLQSGFSTFYSFELAEPGSSGALQTYYFGPSPEAEARARDGLLVDVRPHVSRPWRGRFQFGDIRLSRY